MSKPIVQLIEQLKSRSYQHKKIILGFDGFIDEIIHPVDKRIDMNHYTRIQSLSDFAKRIDRASGLSTNIELYSIAEKIGGNGPIMANALAMYQGDVTYIGALGYPNIDPTFFDMPSNVKLYSVAQAAHTDALEFLDGKLMLGKMKSLSDVNYENIIKSLGRDYFIQLLSTCDLFATVNWSMLPHMTEIWEQVRLDCLSSIKPRQDKPIFFVDLADPEKREKEEIIKALNLLKTYNSHFKVILGLNKKEAYDTARLLGIGNEQSSLEEIARGLYHYLDIYSVVIHPVDQSCTIIDGKYAQAYGPLSNKPKLTTGAGDNFNAGFVFGLLLGLNAHDALLMGMATSGFYVRQAKSPTYVELLQFLNDWDQNVLD
ncbi:MAG: PfkB family carbohydrate kinase [Acholeplasmataceae bacterium]|jgi:sugar/nucleoside kinase (ribokinase family)|nr:PfkB family carbohydrate kinase [Acholeplasmataceae bacterium]